MKKLLATLFSTLLLNSSFAQAEMTFVEESEVDAVEKVVELRVTFAPPPSAEVKKARKAMLIKSGKAICSGSFISAYGHILTAKHCVEGSTEIEVLTHDNRIYRGEIRAQAEGADLAVLQIGRFGTPHFKLGKSLEQSDPIEIIGSPVGLSFTKTAGIVSKVLGDYVILDCTGVPGNSGGPVINEDGELVGVVSAMIIVFFGPAHLTVVQSVDSILFFFYKSAGGR